MTSSILGGGSGGYACALRAAELGLTVALVEKDKLGGTCLHRGCIPTKALLHAAEVADTARESDAVRRAAPRFDGIDMAGVNELQGRRRRPALQGPAGPGEEPRDHLRRGRRAGSSPPNTVEVDGAALHRPQRRPRHRLVRPHACPAWRSAAGSSPATRRSTSTTCPQRVVVLGGGVIGVEFACVWKSFGAEVTIVEALPRLVPARGRGRAPRPLERAFRKRRIAFQTGVRFAGGDAERRPASRSRSSPARRIEADLLLVAVGRGPNTDRPRLRGGRASAMDRGFVLTDERLRTNVAGVYAVGDIVPGLQLAHRGFAAGHLRRRGDRRARTRRRSTSRASRGSPTASPRSPRSGSPRRRPRRSSARTTSRPTSTTSAATARARSWHDPGFVKLVRAEGRPRRRRPHGRRPDRRADRRGPADRTTGRPTPRTSPPLVHAHPTQNEALGEAHLALAGKPLHAHA